MAELNINGHIVIIDDSDLEIIKPYKWTTKKIGNTRYAMHRIYETREKELAPLLMHRLIMKAKKGQIVDHVNRNGLDNRRKNLRLCSYSQNSMNCIKKPGISGFNGVRWHKAGKAWQARFHYTEKGVKKELHLGLFKTKIEAAKAYDKKILEVHGEFALTNKMQGLYNE